jgi:hypothetical protein
MPLYRLLQNQAFDPLQIEAMAYAFEAVCQERKLRPLQDDPQRELVAKKVIELAQRGERDPTRLRDLVLAALPSP